jgi:hypothetical protein
LVSFQAIAEGKQKTERRKAPKVKKFERTHNQKPIGESTDNDDEIRSEIRIKKNPQKRKTKSLLSLKKKINNMKTLEFDL